MTKTLGKVVPVLNVCRVCHEVDRLVSWCARQLNASKTREMIVDFRKRKTPLAPIIINGDSIERVDCFKFLGTIITSGFVGKTTQTLSSKRLNKGCSSCAN